MSAARPRQWPRIARRTVARPRAPGGSVSSHPPPSPAGSVPPVLLEIGAIFLEAELDAMRRERAAPHGDPQPLTPGDND